MKAILIALCITFAGSAFAMETGECKKIAAFRANQQNKLSLSRYGLGLISAVQLKAQQDANNSKMLDAWKACEATK